MAKSFSNADVKRVQSEYQRIFNKLSEASRFEKNYKNDIKSAAEKLISSEIMEILKDIPVEELNRDKKGIRIKSLHDYGYHTVADIYSASIYSIASVKGVSEDTAYTIKRCATDIYKKISVGSKIKISSDNKSQQSSELVHALYQYRHIQPVAKECSKLLRQNQIEVNSYLRELSFASSSLKWFFIPSAKKQKAETAYQYLSNLLSGSYGQNADQLIRRIEAIKKANYGDAWVDFGINSVIYFNRLEELCPGLLGNNDSVYGLSEELANEIQEECFFPDGLLCELRRYQEWGVKYALHQGKVLLGDEMGLGKTVQAIATIVSLKNTGGTHFIVVCPASVLTNWCREIRKMSKLSVIKVHGSDRNQAMKSWIKTGGVAVTTYETTSYFEFDDDFIYEMLVVDEAHYIKNPDAQRSINVKTLATHAKRLLFMTGTALENKVEEMISLISILQPNIAARLQGMESLVNAPLFRNRVAPVYYRRKREDVLTELPDLIESREWCSMGREEEIEYEKAVLSKNYAASRRVSWNVENLRNSSKAMRLLELVEEAKNEGRKVIVFSFFLDTIRKIADLLGDNCTNPINGSVSPQRRQEIIDEFDKAPAGTVLVAQIQSGGTGLNIQSASVVILCEPQFKPSIENQAISRAYRMGQTRNVLVYRLLCENSVDEKLMQMIESKQRIFDAFADKAVATETFEIDEQTFGDIIKEEIERINAKNEN